MANLVALTQAQIQTLNSNECEICYEELDNDAVQMRCCSQIYHRTCINEWVTQISYQRHLHRRMKCPHCRHKSSHYVWWDLLHATDRSWMVRKQEAKLNLPYLTLISQLSFETTIDVIDYVIHRTAQITDAGVLSAKDPVIREQIVKAALPRERTIVRCLFDDKRSFKSLVQWWYCIPVMVRHGLLSETIATENVKETDDDKEEETSEFEQLLNMSTIYGRYNDDFMPALPLRLLKEEQVILERQIELAVNDTVDQVHGS